MVSVRRLEATCKSLAPDGLSGDFEVLADGLSRLLLGVKRTEIIDDYMLQDTIGENAVLDFVVCF